ncbi:MAG: cryptochrome/photolyase family protein, partial [Planctomycetota bacterium]
QETVLIEDSLYFGDPRYPVAFHKQKLWLHRATMQRYGQRLRQQNRKVQYVDFSVDAPVLNTTLAALQRRRVKRLIVAEPADFILEKRLGRLAAKHGFELTVVDSPGFLNTNRQNDNYRSGKKRWFMADYYKEQRRRLDVLIQDGEPVGGKWSFDEDNRKKVPKNRLHTIPELPTVNSDPIDLKARSHVNEHFESHPGSLGALLYPTSHESAERWLDQFLQQRFDSFGIYEDAIVPGQNWLWHSVLTPMLNIGLLTPRQVLDRTLRYADANKVPINSLEGFVRQLIGWREFMRATYRDLGVSMRTTNHWQHTRAIPQSFYDASTGIDPVDDVIERVNSTGYCHHIERLMVLGGFMFLCEFDPDEIYRWFMEMFVDAYDWVMVPNVYAMSQNADGGQITTKPYFSGSAYIKKMSHFKHGEWADTWDGLYWRWIWSHRKELGKNPRWAMMCKMSEKMDTEKRKTHLRNAEQFLKGLDR